MAGSWLLISCSFTHLRGGKGEGVGLRLHQWVIGNAGMAGTNRPDVLNKNLAVTGGDAG